MKRSVLRIGCAVLSLSAAAGLLASCSLLPPASPLPDSKPAQAEEAPGPAAAPLDDGKLRILYSNGSNGGNTVLCGNTVLYQAASSETVYLVPDTLTGAVRYYLRQWSAPGTPTGRATALCDRSGKEILTFDRAYDAVLTGSLLVLTAPEQMAYAPCNNHAPGDCRVIDLATGEELAVPENAYGCSVAGSYLAFEVCNVPADYVQENEWGDDLTAYCAVQVQDRQGEVVYQAELSGLSSFYASSSDSSAPTDWLVVSHYNEDGTTGADSLYNPATGEELTGFQQYTGAGTVCLYNSGRYQLVDLASTEQSAVLCEFDEPSLEDHGMGHQALAIVQALGFGHGEPGIQQIFQTTDVEIHDAGIPLGVLAHVAAEPDGLAVFHLGDGSLLQLFDGQVEVAHGAALFHVAQVLHGVAAAVGLILGGSIDEADIIAQVNAHILFKEALGGQALFTVEVVVLIAVLKGKGLGRLAQADAEQAVDLAQHPGLAGAQLVQASALLVWSSYPKSY